ncbi:MAG: protein-tyrosine kinase [Thermodesulfobacteriota bacterium]|nr:protein-tyrosine kinase [Thermodesulfobacteriota bacterium]
MTVRDLFGSIPKPIDVDPFEGIDMEGINIPRPDTTEGAPPEELELSSVSPIKGVDLSDISILNIRPRTGSREEDLDRINPLTGIDMKDLGVQPEDHKDAEVHAPEEPVRQRQISPSSEDASEVGAPLRNKLSKAYRYAEINRIRENVVKALQENKQKTVLITSPHDDAGNTFLVSVLGFNAAYFTNMSVLLIDLNMRRPFLHKAFGLTLAGGFNEVAMDLIDWRDAIKDTGLAELKVMTAGESSRELSFFLNRAFIKNMLKDIRSEFELIIIDTSPVLISNINNVDPVYLSTVCDMVILVVQDKMTSKTMLTDAVDTIRDGGGDVNAIVYNRQF